MPLGEITFGQFLRGYVAMLVSVVGLALALERWAGIDGHRTIYVACGALFLLASTGRPRSLFAVIRHTGWFAAIESDRAMRLLLALLGTLLVGAGLFVAGAGQRP
jgi:hypothetical protein